MANAQELLQSLMRSGQVPDAASLLSNLQALAKGQSASQARAESESRRPKTENRKPSTEGNSTGEITDESGLFSLNRNLKARVDERFSPEEQLEIFGDQTPSDKQMWRALNDATAVQAGITPGFQSEPILGGIFGGSEEFAIRKQLGERQRELDRTLDRVKEKTLLKDLEQSRRISEASQRSGSTAGELHPDVRAQFEEQGRLPTKSILEEIIPLGPQRAVLTPTGLENPNPERSIFQSPPAINPQADLNAAFGNDPISDVLTTRFGRETLLGDQGSSLFSALARGIPQDIEQASREADPGLSTRADIAQVTDLDAPLTTQDILQADLLTQTMLQTPRSEKIPLDDARDIIKTTIVSGGGTLQQAQDIANTIQSDVPLSTLNKVVGEVGRGIQTSVKGFQKNAQQQAHFSQQERLIGLRANVSNQLLNRNKELSLENALTIKQTSFEHQQALDAGRLDGRIRLAERSAKMNFDNRLALQENNLENAQLNRDAALMRQVLKGEQAIGLEELRAANRLALADSTDDDAIGASSILEKYYLDFMKSNPAVAGQLADILANTPSGELDLSTNEALRVALNKRHNEIVGGKIVQDRLDTIVNTEVFGNTIPERMSALFNAIETFNKQGIDTTSMQKQLDFMNTIKSGQTINIDTKPIGTPKEREDITFLRSVLRDIEFIGHLYDSGFTGFFDDIEAKGKSFVGLVGKREEAFRSAVDRIKSELVSEKAGAAIGPMEAALLLSSIPTLDDTDSRFLANMSELARSTRNLLGDRYSLLGLSPESRFKELDDIGKSPGEIERTMIREGLIPPREKGGSR